MINKFLLLVCMLLYVYTLTFDIFLNQYIRIPTPFFCLPLIFLWGDIKRTQFLYGRELIFIFLACFIYYGIGYQQLNSFIINFIVIAFCGLYFNYFVGFDKARFNWSLIVFFSLLTLSSIVLLINQFNLQLGDSLRSKLIGAPVRQSPSGISSAIFTFGYQAAALTGFIFIYAIKKRWNLLVKCLILTGCLVLLYLGLQRSAALAFVVSLLLFAAFYYRGKAVLIISLLVIAVTIVLTIVDLNRVFEGSTDNIFAKNERSTENGENREGLVIENLRIYSQYPFGLIFHGKTWKEATADSFIFRNGLTSHNAYLMFLTYLGPFLGIAILIGLFYKHFHVFKKAISEIRVPENTALIALCFSFLTITINSMFHNASFISANGPTVFLYFAILHCNKLKEF